MGSIWLDMGSYLVRMKRTGSRKLSKCLPDLWDTIKIKNHEKSGKNRKSRKFIYSIYFIYSL